ncbi:MAG TPA: hypothetical protein VIL21_00695, partial [Solirubrobacterales bacterium]
ALIELLAFLVLARSTFARAVPAARSAPSSIDEEQPPEATAVAIETPTTSAIAISFLKISSLYTHEGFQWNGLFPSAP